MHLEYVARRTMKPAENDHRVPYGDGVKGLRDRLRDLYPSVGCAFVALARGRLASREIRPDKANRLESIAGVSHSLGLLRLPSYCRATQRLAPTNPSFELGVISDPAHRRAPQRLS
jgi:hypothetical protein